MQNLNDISIFLVVRDETHEQILIICLTHYRCTSRQNIRAADFTEGLYASWSHSVPHTPNVTECYAYAGNISQSIRSNIERSVLSVLLLPCATVLHIYKIHFH